MPLHLHNTLTRRKEVFTPRDPKNVRMYVCGPTVYQRIHIGNARPLVVFDVLFRLLRHLYGADHVKYVRNITDIDDKIIDQVRRDGATGDLNAAVRALTDRTAAAFREDCAALGLLEPTHEPRATDHIPGMIGLIGRLVERGHAYAAEGHVLFSVPSWPDYGRLSRRSRDDQIAGARVEVAPYKRDAADFVLWKPSTPDQPGWDSPWGRGRPGWHIECSAMSEALLGPLPFDIHAGGQDLVFPHHENEIAQSCCADGVAQMATYWLHNGFVDMSGEKMSKSVGNVVEANEALALADEIQQRRSEIIRLWLLGTHYRQPLSFTKSTLHEARENLIRFYRVLDQTSLAETDSFAPDAAFMARLLDDLDTVGAVVRLRALVDEAFLELKKGDHRRAQEVCKAIVGSGAVLGILGNPPSFWLRGEISWNDTGSAIDQWTLTAVPLEDRLRERIEARKAKNFARADAIRAELSAHGIILEDRPDGTTDWRRA